MSMASPIWPTAYAPRPRRGLVFLTLAIVSITGFFSGIALHPLLRIWHDAAFGGGQHIAAVATVAPTAIPTLLPMTPEPFVLTLSVAPTSIAPGGQLSLTTHATLARDRTIAARGVLCQPTFDGVTWAASIAAVTTDDTGTATWTVQIPPDTAAGTYKVTVTGHWGTTNSYYFYTFITVTG